MVWCPLTNIVGDTGRSDSLGALEPGEIVNFTETAPHTGDGNETVDVIRLRIVPSERFPEGGWVSEKSQLKCKHSLSVEVCRHNALTCTFEQLLRQARTGV